MRDRVDERDGHEAADELGLERPLRLDDRLSRTGRPEVGDRHEENAADQARYRKPRRDQLGGSGRVEDVRPLDVRAQVLPERRPAEPVEADGAEHDRDEGEVARDRLAAGEPRERHPDDQASVARAEGRDPREQAEVDGERLAALGPQAPAEGRHSEPRRVAVQRDRERQRARAGRRLVAELERGEAEEEHRARPDAEPLGVGERRGPAAPQSLRDPGNAVGDREPRVDRRPDITEQNLDGNEAEPEDHVHERRREVLRRRRLSHERGREDERQQARRDEAEQHAQSRRPQDAFEPHWQRPAYGSPLELRAAPERTEQEERENEHDSAGPQEEPVRDRQVANASEAVCEQGQGRTSSSAI